GHLTFPHQPVGDSARLVAERQGVLLVDGLDAAAQENEAFAQRLHRAPFTSENLARAALLRERVAVAFRAEEEGLDETLLLLEQALHAAQLAERLAEGDGGHQVCLPTVVVLRGAEQ